MSKWTLFSNHGHVLVCLSRDNEARLRNVAYDVGITERAVQKIVSELQQAGYITISKHGRCNRYEINSRKSMRHALEAKCNVGKLLQLFRQEEKRSTKGVSPSPEKKNETTTANNEPSPVKQTKTAVTEIKKVEPVPMAPLKISKTVVTGTTKADPAPVATLKSSKVLVDKPKDKVSPEKNKKASKKPADEREQGSLF